MINWIKATDRLPEADKEQDFKSIPVLVYMPYGAIDTCEYFYDLHNFVDGYGYSIHNITHWANLSDINLPNE